MKRFIRAVGGMKNSVIYTDTDERDFRFSEGTWAWRNHNPGMFGLDQLVKNIIKLAKRIVLLFSQMINLDMNPYWIP